MAFDLKAFGVTVVAVVIAAYVLNFLGYLKHSSPLAMSVGGDGGMSGFGAPSQPLSYSDMGVVPDLSGVGHPALSSGTIGATELSGETGIRPL